MNAIFVETKPPQLTIKSGEIEALYNRQEDKLVVTHQKLSEDVDKDEVRIVNNYKQVTIYEDRYSGQEFKIEIGGYFEYEWFILQSLLTYMFVVHFEMKEADANSLAINIQKNVTRI